MRVPIAYSLVVLIWSTTPLSIQLSNADFGFMGALAWRMSIGVVLAYLYLRWQGSHLCLAKHWRSYVLGGLGIFPTMGLVYWSAQWVPSGVISIMFAANPFLVGGLSYLLLQQERLSPLKIVGMICAFTGLLVIFYDQLQEGIGAAKGVLALLVAINIFSLSSVGLKRWGGAVTPMQQTTGSILCVLPAIWLAWWLMDGKVPTWDVSVSLAAVLYLAVFGSVVGFSLYFYLLLNLSPTSVSLIGMITPVFALALGAFLANEAITGQLMAGAGLVLLGLLCYQGLAAQWLRKRL